MCWTEKLVLLLLLYYYQLFAAVAVFLPKQQLTSKNYEYGRWALRQLYYSAGLCRPVGKFTVENRMLK